MMSSGRFFDVVVAMAVVPGVNTETQAAAPVKTVATLKAFRILFALLAGVTVTLRAQFLTRIANHHDIGNASFVAPPEAPDN